MRYTLPLCLLIMLMIFNSAEAQVKFGIKAGLNTTDVDADDIRVLTADDRDQLRLKVEDANYGINIGLYLLAKSKRLFIQPEIIYNSSTTDFRIDTLLDGTEFLDQVFEERYRTLDIPVIMGLRFGFLRIGAGPVGHLHLSSTSDLLDFDGYEQDFETITWGYQAGLGVDFWSINLDLRYEGNFSNYGDHVRLFNEQFDFSDRPSRLVGTIGISF